MDQSKWNTTGMISPTSMFVHPRTREVLGPSVPKGTEAVPAWVEKYRGVWVEVTDRQMIKAIVAWRYPKKVKLRMDGREA